jgi:exonuclease SbcC
MRLHRLELSAFLAFPGTETVDFDALGEAGLFLLHGRTGAGKTALLDAVCFAFYGEVPGARQEAARLRSDHAPPETPTEVVLEATLRGRRIRIARTPAHERRKKVGDGTTTEPHRVRVVAIEEDGSETVLATRHEEARLELGDLLGMSREQFCQVVLLPQGGFARFLHARSDERERLLGELFDVGRFADVERWLRDRRHEAERALAAATRDVRDAIARAEQVAGADAPEGADHAPGLAVAWLDEQLVVSEATAATAGVAAGEARDARMAAEAALAAGVELAERRAEHARATGDLAAWEARRPGRDAAAAELAAARRAAPVQALADALAARDAAVQDAERTAGAALDGAERAGVRVETIDPAALRAAAAAMRADAGAAQALSAREAAVETAAAAVAELERAAAERAAEAERLAGSIATAERQRPEFDAALSAAREAAARLPGLEREAAAARERAVRGAERDRLATAAQAARAEHLQAREAAVAARATHNDLLARRLDGIAAELAGRLAGGEPCAVCGSREHPSPAPAPDAGLVEEAAVRGAAADADRLEAARDAGAERLARLETALAAARAVAGEMPLAELELTSEAAIVQHADAREQAIAAEPLAARLAELDAELSAAAGRGATAERAAAAAATEARERAAALAAERAAVETGRHGAPSIAARVQALTAAAAAAESAAAALDTAAGCAREATAARERASAAAAAAGFDDLDALRSALREPDACARIETNLRRFDDGLAERRSAAARAELTAAAAVPAPDVGALERAAAAASAAAEQAQRALVLAQRRHTDLAALRGRLDAALTAAAPARERHALVRELAELANGTAASNRLRMRLSAYVLAARLEEVAAAASARLGRMSGGRYALEHADDTAKGNRRGGLDLRVVDAWTGRARPPASLSGGETFLASLALALGLADVVTAEAGGARLETLFVDEGFGTLDDEGTLDEVLEVLDALRDGGRAIGIVSHVAELRQRIPAQLRIEKSRDGSRVLQPVGLAG